MRSNIDFSKIYSYSKLNMYDQCPQRYYFYYLDPEISPRKKEFIKPRDYKTKGQAVHGAITLFYHLPKTKRTFDNLKKCLYEAWYSEQDAKLAPPLGQTGGFKTIDHERKTYHQSLVLLKNFLSLKDIDPDLFLIPTKNIRESFSDYEDMIQVLEKDVSISGKFDRIDRLENGNLKIIDFKTSKDEIDGCFQLEFYKLLAEMNFNAKVDLVSYYYLDGKKIKNYDFSGVDNMDIKNKILNKVKLIEETAVFNPKPNFFCGHCDFKEICPDYKNKTKVETN